MPTMFDVYPLHKLLGEAMRLARQAELPDTYMQLEEIRKKLVSEFHAVRAIKQVGGTYPSP
jgi:hypothetical protein